MVIWNCFGMLRISAAGKHLFNDYYLFQEFSGVKNSKILQVLI